MCLLHSQVFFWSQSAEGLINKACEDLKQFSWPVKELERRGIRSETAEYFSIGYEQKDLNVSGAIWGLDRDSLWIPQGLLISNFCLVGNDQRCIKLKVRRQKIDDKLPKYIEIPGSSKSCMIFGYCETKVPLILESELDTIKCLQEAQNEIWCVALGGASKPMDEGTDALLKRSPLILWALDQDAAGKERYFAFRERYPQLRAWPADRAKSPGDMLVSTIRPWIQRGIQRYSSLIGFEECQQKGVVYGSKSAKIG